MNGFPVRRMAISELVKAPYNPRHISDEQRAALKKSVESFGLVEPIVWNQQTRNVVGGHQRIDSLVALDIAETDVIVVDLDAEHEKALNLALNKISGEWDEQKLADLLRELSTTDLDMALTGFSEEEIQSLFTNIPEGGNGAEHSTLFEKFLVPPFSVLDARQGYWQERKQAWLALGIQSEIGRGGGLDDERGTGHDGEPQLLPQKTTSSASVSK